jgi:hypothetical protein
LPDLLGQRAFVQQEAGLAAVLLDHAVADEAVAHAGDHGRLLDLLAICMTVASTSFAVFSPRTTSSSFITLAGLKKCMPTTSCGRFVNGDLVDVERGGVGGRGSRRASSLRRAA